MLEPNPYSFMGHAFRTAGANVAEAQDVMAAAKSKAAMDHQPGDAASEHQDKGTRSALLQEMDALLLVGNPFPETTMLIKAAIKAQERAETCHVVSNNE